MQPAAVKGVNRAVEAVTEAGLDRAMRDRPAAPEAPVPLRSDATGSAPWLGDAALAVVNAAVGDYLHDADNGLSLGMHLRAGDTFLPLDEEGLAAALPDATGRVVVLVHGYAISQRGVAELLDIAVSTVREHLARAMTKLRDELEDRHDH